MRPGPGKVARGRIKCAYDDEFHVFGGSFEPSLLQDERVRRARAQRRAASDWDVHATGDIRSATPGAFVELDKCGEVEATFGVSHGPRCLGTCPAATGLDFLPSARFTS